MLSLNHKIHYLGKLCPQGHEYRQTGRSLRYRTSRGCIQCCFQKINQGKHWLKPKAVERKRLYDIDYRKKTSKLKKLKNRVYKNKEGVKERAIFLLSERLKNPEYLAKRNHDKEIKSQNERKIIINAYVRAILHKTTGIDYDDITPKMIKLKRELLIFHRLKKELTDGINSRGNQRTSTDGKTA